MYTDNDNPHQLPVEKLVAIDQACIAFERGLLNGETPEIERCLDTVHDPDAKSVLLAELIALEIEYRTASGGSTKREDYVRRFPENSDAVDAAFQSDRVHTKRHDVVPPVESFNLNSEFKISRFHARGGLGVVYVAKDQELGREVAVKFARHRDLDDSQRLRFRREAEITGRLNHPGIVSVHAVNRDSDELPCYVMQFIQGQTFQEAVAAFHSEKNKGDKFRSREFRQLLQRLVAAADTVAYAHQYGVIHRDIKPSNIMLGKFGETYLLDWGLAKIIASDLLQQEVFPPQGSLLPNSWSQATDDTLESTRPGQAIGTPGFASPEQVAGQIEEHDQRSDVFSLGATLYFLLVGRPAVDVSDFDVQKSAVALRKISAPIQADPAIPADLNAICMKAMSLKSNQRYQTAAGLSDDLERYLADEAVSARKPSRRARLRRWTAKNPRWATGLATGILVAVIALTISAWLLSQKADELSIALATQKKTNKELVRARESAEKSATETLGALRALSHRISLQWFVKQKTFTDKDKQYLEDILALYEDFAKTQNDAFFTRAVRAEGWQRVGQVQQLLGRNADALKSMQTVVDLLTPLPPDASISDRKVKATCLCDLGKFHVRGGAKDLGVEEMKQAIELFRELAVDFPEIPEHLNLLSKAQKMLGNSYVALGEAQLAMEQYTMAKETTAELAKRFPDNINFQLAYRNTLTNMGVSFYQRGKFEESVEEHQLAEDIFNRLASSPEIESDPYQLNGPAINSIGMAKALTRLHRLKESAAKYQHAAVSARHAIDIFPGYPDGHANLARALYGEGFINEIEMEYESAVENYREALEPATTAIERSPQSRAYLRIRVVIQRQLASVLLKNGNLSEAESEYLKCIDWSGELLELDSRLDHLVKLARDYYSLGEVQERLGRSSDAAEQFKKTVEILEADESKSEYKPLRQLVAAASNKLATILFEAGECDHSIEYWDRVIKFDDDEKNLPITLSARAICLAEATPEIALAEVASILEQGPFEGRTLYNLASASARAAHSLQSSESRDAALDQAFEMLQQAREKGFFERADIVSQFPNDKSFIWMKDETRFEDFVAQLKSDVVIDKNH